MSGMWEYIKIAVMNIRSNKARSFLTMLGIIIGISSVILIVSSGTGIKTSIKGQLDELAGGYVEIYSNSADENGNYVEFDEDLIDAITSKVDHIKGITPLWNWRGSSINNKGSFQVSALFGNENLQYYINAPLIRGRYFTKSEVDKASKVCVINEKGAKKLFGSTDVLGLTVNLSLDGISQDFTIVGIRKDSDSAAKSMMFASGDFEMEIPNTVLESSYGYYMGFSSFMIFCEGSEYSKSVGQQALQITEAKYNCRGTDMVKLYDLGGDIDQISSILNYVTMFVVLVAAISLLVGGIGVMNIMLVSVTERTKEIGIRKALGAKTGSIMFQFLMEATIITLIGGAIGIILGVLGAKGVCAIVAQFGLGKIEAVISPVVVLVATGFSSMIGIFFGIYPAKKAAKMSPIDALRHE